MVVGLYRAVQGDALLDDRAGKLSDAGADDGRFAESEGGRNRFGQCRIIHGVVLGSLMHNSQTP